MVWIAGRMALHSLTGCGPDRDPSLMVRSWDVAQDLPTVDVREVIRDERRELVDFLGSLNDERWATPTVNPGWSVHDVALHLVGNDIGRLRSRSTAGFAQTPPGELAFEELAMWIEQSNEQWVTAARRIAPPLLVELLAFVGPKVDAVFAAADLDAPGLAVAWTGTGPTPLWLDLAREYAERWVHYAQIRIAVGEPPLLARRWLHPVLDAFMRCLPRAYEDVQATEGTIVRVEVTGQAGDAWFVRRGLDRWHLVPDADREPVAAVRLDSDTAWRLLSRTMTVKSAMTAIAVEGDEKLARAATRAVAIMTSRL